MSTPTTSITVRTVESAERLQDLMDRLNEAGDAATLLILDRGDVPYMAFGEERSEGGEAMTCWLTPTDPASGDYDRPASHYDMDTLPALEWELSAAVYPIDIVGPRTALAALSRLLAPGSASESADRRTSDFLPGELALYGLPDQPPDHYSKAEIAMMDEQAAIADAEALPTWVQQMIDAGLHVGRSFGARRHIEDACPCPQEPCGLVALTRVDPRCEQHTFTRTFRQMHHPDQCAEITAHLAGQSSDGPTA